VVSDLCTFVINEHVRRDPEDVLTGRKEMRLLRADERHLDRRVHLALDLLFEPEQAAHDVRALDGDSQHQVALRYRVSATQGEANARNLPAQLFGRRRRARPSRSPS
jgi:hypothetical protein